MSKANAAKTVCKFGHALSGENLYVSRTRGVETRHCRICRKAATARRVRQVTESIETGPRLELKQVLRLRDAWLYSDATRAELMSRFGISNEELCGYVAGLKRAAF